MSTVKIPGSFTYRPLRIMAFPPVTEPATNLVGAHLAAAVDLAPLPMDVDITPCADPLSCLKPQVQIACAIFVIVGLDKVSTPQWIFLLNPVRYVDISSGHF